GDEFHRSTEAYEARETLRPSAAGNDAEVDFRQPELGVVGGDSERASKRNLETRAKAIAVDGSDGRQPQRFEQAGKLATKLRGRRKLARRCALRDLVDVGAC